MFGELCGLDMSSIPKCKLSSVLANTIQPLPDGKPYKVAVDGRQIWHPNFLGHVDDELNTKFISEVVQRVFDNETVRKSVSMTERTYKAMSLANSRCRQLEGQHT
jgi:hypothetical protein